MFFGFVTPDNLIDSFLAGVICGVIPLYFSTGRDRVKLGLVALAACVVGGLVLGLLLAVPLAAFFLWRILRAGERADGPVPFQVQARNRQRVIAIMAALGIVVAGYLTWSHYSGVPVYCGVSSSCEVVNTSRYAYLGDIPVALIGLIGYIAILALSLIPPQEERQWPMLLIFGGALIGALLQWYLFYIEVAVLRAICYWCVTSQAIITLIFLLAFPRRDPAVLEEEEADQAG